MLSEQAKRIIEKRRSRAITVGPLRRTRYSGLGYRRIGPDWRFVMLPEVSGLQSDADGLTAIGNYYRSQAEPLGDLERFATADDWPLAS